MSTLSDRIKEAMGKRTPAEFARAVKVTPASVTFWLDGSTKSLKADKAAQIEQATGYRALWIVTGKGPKRVTSDPVSVFEALTEDERRMLDNLRDIAVDEEQYQELMDLISSKAAKLRAMREKWLAQAQISSSPARHAADAKKTEIARAALDVTERLRQQSFLDPPKE
jgi:transcriptional regulator with XRE-family HTH domain